MKAESSCALFTDVFSVHEMEPGTRRLLQQAGGLRALEPARGLGGDWEIASIMMRWKMSLRRRRVGWRLRLEPGGGGGGLVHGTSEAEPCRREAEKGLEEEWHCINHAAAAAKSLQSCPTLCDPIDVWQPTRFPCPWDSPGKNTGVGCR